MQQTAVAAVAQPEQIPVKATINPDAYYTIKELQVLGLGKYLKWRRAILAGKIKAYYSGRNVLLRGDAILAYIGVTQK